MVRPRVRIGEPLDFSAYAGAGGDRDVLRWVTDEIMAAVQELSGQEYVDAYGASVKAALAEGREFDAAVVGRPGEGREPPMPPVPVPPAATVPTGATRPASPRDVGRWRLGRDAVSSELVTVEPGRQAERRRRDLLVAAGTSRSVPRSGGSSGPSRRALQRAATRAARSWPATTSRSPTGCSCRWRWTGG